MNTMNRFASPKNERRDSLALLKNASGALISCIHLRQATNEKNVFFIRRRNQISSRIIV